MNSRTLQIGILGTRMVPEVPLVLPILRAILFQRYIVSRRLVYGLLGD